MAAPRRRENDSKRVAKSIEDHSNAMEALRRATAQPYDANRESFWDAPYTFVHGSDVVSKGEGANAPFFKNNVRKLPKKA